MEILRFNKLLFVIHTVIIGALVSPIPTQAQTSPPPTKLEAASVMGQVNNYWISQHLDPGDNEWARAVYYIGDLAHYMTTDGAYYLDYVSVWAEQHSWQLFGGCNTAHADNQVAGRAYLALNDLDHDPQKIQCITTSIDGVVGRYLNNETLNDWIFCGS